MSTQKPTPPRGADAQARTDACAPPARLSSLSLFGAASVVFIDHGGETYCLRRTRLGKLILTK